MKINFAKKTKSVRSLSSILKKNSGRDNTGTISVRHQGGRQKRKYRDVDFVHTMDESTRKVIAFEYDPNRSANIMRLRDDKGNQSYILHVEGAKIGTKIVKGKTGDANIGAILPLRAIPLGTEIHNLATIPMGRSKMVRSSGAYAVILAKDDNYADIKLPSREIKKFLLDCMATVGRVAEVKSRSSSKAGTTRHKGVRPTVRGVAQNPRTHPHGGGEGRTGEGMHPKTPWGKPARGKRTANKRRSSKQLIVTSRRG